MTLNPVTMNRMPTFFSASCADARGFPRVEQALPHDLSPPPPGGSLAKFMAVFRANTERIRRPGLLRVTLENKGSRWPDFIGGHNLDSYGLLASARVLETLRREGIGGFTPIPVEFVRMPAKLSSGEVPRYHALRPDIVLPRLIHVFEHGEGTLTPLGRYAHPGPAPEALGWKPGRCSLSQPLNRRKHEDMLLGGAFRGFCCSRRIAGIAFREKWTNLQFRAFDLLYASGIEGHYVPPVPSGTGSMDGPWYGGLQDQAWRLAGF